MADHALATREIHNLLESPAVKTELRKALPKHLNPERLLRIAATTIQRSPGLRECTPISLLACIIETAQLGLEPDGVLGESYIVAFKNKKTGKKSATLIPGYKGLMKLVFQTGVVNAINAELVRKGDFFAMSLGTKRSLIHEPKIELREGKEDAQWAGVYATVTYKNGATDFEYFTAAEISAIRARSRSANDGPWVTDTEAMWKKSAIRRLAKRLPKSTTDHMLARAVALDELADSDKLVPTTHGFEISEESESTEAVAEEKPIEATREVAAEPEPAKKPLAKELRDKKKKLDETNHPTTASGIPKAQIPKGDVIDVQPEKPKADPYISSPEQSELYNKAAQMGWKLPEALKAVLMKHFKVDSIMLVKRSQVAKLKEIIESGE